MDKAKQNITRNRYTTTVLLGVLLLVIGIFLLIHSISTIQDNEKPLNSISVTLEQVSNYDGSPSWWKNAYVTLVLPLTSVFVALSGIILFTQPIIMTIEQKRKQRTLKNVKPYPEIYLQAKITNENT